MLYLLAIAKSIFFLYVRRFVSVQLMASVDADGCFITIDVEDYGRNSDGGVFRSSRFQDSLYKPATFLYRQQSLCSMILMGHLSLSSLLEMKLFP